MFYSYFNVFQQRCLEREKHITPQVFEIVISILERLKLVHRYDNYWDAINLHNYLAYIYV